MATVDVPLFWSGSSTTPRFTARQRSFSVASGLSNGGTARTMTVRRTKLSVFYDFRRNYSLRKRDQSYPQTVKVKVLYWNKLAEWKQNSYFQI